MKTTVAVLDKRGNNAVLPVATTLEKLSDIDAVFVTAMPSKIITDQNLAKRLFSSTVVGFTSTMKDTPRMVKLEEATLAFEGRIYSFNTKNALTNFFLNKTYADYATAAEAFLRNVEGDYSIVIAQTEQLLAARDPVGVQPLYFGDNQEIAALASNRKILWRLGIERANSFPPGNIATITKEGFQFKPIKTLAFREPKPLAMLQAAKKLQKLLEYSVKIRVSGQKEVAVAFSGGLDSSLVACVARKCGIDVQLIHVSLEEQAETEEAKRAATEMGLPLQVHLFNEADLEKVVPKVVELIEEPDPIKASIGVPFYWNAQKAAEAGYRVLLAGQGADELFGGYQRYVNDYIREGDKKVRRTMFHDVAVIHESNIERDEKICGENDVELRLPFASYKIAEFAMSLPTQLKFERKADSLRKLVLRKTAQNLGLPEDIVNKPKKAIQYSTGISNALKKLAKKQKVTLAGYINQLFLEDKDRFEKGTK